MSGLDRREFLELGVLGLAGCAISEPDDVIVPYKDAPPEVLPGVPLHYATSAFLGGHATGLLAACVGGRPVKLEGNPEHPASLGKSGVFEQALLYELYDPHRARDVRNIAGPTGRGDLERFLAGLDLGRGLEIVSEPTSSPTVVRLLGALTTKYPRTRVHYWDPLAPRERWLATRALFGKVLDPVYQLEAAEVLVALDDDLLASGPNHLRHAQDFVARGKRRTLIAVDTGCMPTAQLADRRLTLRRRDVGTLLAVIFSEVAAAILPRQPTAMVLAEPIARVETLTPHAPWARAVARQLLAHPGRALLTVGVAQPAWVQALGLATNALLDNLGKTLTLVEPAVHQAGGDSHEPPALEKAELAVFLGCDPVHTLPDFALSGARHTLAASLYSDATARACEWHVPLAHGLETWADGRAYDGTLSLAQPLVRPLWQGMSAIELLALLAGEHSPSGRDLLQKTHAAAPFDTWLKHGLAPGSARTAQSPALDWSKLQALVSTALAGLRLDERLEVSFNADPRVHDGRFIDNPWLLELPQPASQLTWENAALIGERTARKLEVRDGDLLSVGGVELPAVVVPGHAEETVGVTLGWGQPDRPGAGAGAGVDVYRVHAQRWTRSDLPIGRGHGERRLARTQHEFDQHGRELLRSVVMSAAVVPKEEPPASMHERKPTGRQAWGMSIDLDACLGCGACTLACQAENNIPVVGKTGILKNRQMHWLRLDHYVVGDTGEPGQRRLAIQPMLCQHCEKAPCEYVCPTAATTHSDDGLNEMTYNRCVGTRFCSNNCPYKVRRFNWLDYRKETRGSLELLMNPDVTVRGRGVMEKCTFCVQRIRRAGIDARIQGQPTAPTDSFTTACAQACPTEAIVFGDLADPKSRVSALVQSPRVYRALADLDTAPRVHYLARLVDDQLEVPT